MKAISLVVTKDAEGFKVQNAGSLSPGAARVLFGSMKTDPQPEWESIMLFDKIHPTKSQKLATVPASLVIPPAADDWSLPVQKKVLRPKIVRKGR